MLCVMVCGIHVQQAICRAEKCLVSCRVTKTKIFVKSFCVKQY